MKSFIQVIEVLPAKEYYGNHAIGSVVLINGHVEYHATTKESKAFAKKFGWKETSPVQTC